MENVQCKHKLTMLCYICGMFTPTSKKAVRVSISEKLKAAYSEKYNLTIDTSLDYVPSIVCKPCYGALTDKRPVAARNIPTIPMLWNAPNQQHSDCYVCLCPSFIGRRWEERKTLEYPDYPTTSTRKAVWTSTSSGSS